LAPLLTICESTAKMLLTRLSLLVTGFFSSLLLASSGLLSAEDVRLVSSPTLSPDGTTIALSWRGDIWTVPAAGGSVTRLTTSQGVDNYPEFSPDGKQLAFCSDRNGGMQIFVVPSHGGIPVQYSFHSEGYRLESWCPDGKGFLVTARRDHFWRHSERTFRLANSIDPVDELLFDAHSEQPAISPDGSKVLFIREGTPWWRKGYRGSQRGQLWLYDVESTTYQRLLSSEVAYRSPMWGTDGKTIYYLSSESGSFNLWSHCLGRRKQTRLTSFSDDSVVSPCISRDGSQIVFRHLFDLYRLATTRRALPEKIEISYTGDQSVQPVVRQLLKTAKQAAFTSDGLEVAFIAGGDVWVMDTVLREPRQLTDTPEEESEVLFSAENNILYFVSEAGGQPDIWKAEPADGRKGWWQNDSFRLTKLTDDASTEYRLANRPSKPKLGFLKTKPTLSYLKDRGDLWVADSDGKDAKRLLESWNSIDYDWSPDGKWITYAMSDADFNRDVFIYQVGSQKPPFNLSRHPDDDSDPVWSPDGKTIAFLGRRQGAEVDIYFVQLLERDSEQSPRDRKVKAANKKFSAARRSPALKDPPAKKPADPKDPPAKKPADPKDPPAKKPADPKDPPAKKPADPKSSIRIDFDGIHDRIKVVSIPNSTEGNLVWSPDSRFLAFSATLLGKAGTYTVNPPGDVKPKLFSDQVGSSPRWIKAGNQLLWLVKSVPMASGAGSKNAAYPFTCFQSVDVGKKHRAAFDQCWRSMRDYFYDEKLNNRDWGAIRLKYADMAEGATNRTDLARVVSLMLGELNGSHLGFRVSLPAATKDQWRPLTMHLGARFDRSFKGPGFKVCDVIYGSPAAQEKSKLVAGDVILSVNGKTIEERASLASVLTGLPIQNVKLTVRNAKDEERAVNIRPISYARSRALLYEQWVRNNRETVEKGSGGKLAYLHIQGMNMPSFYRFEQELYEIAGGKEGIVIDVRENGGGFTTDHLLTVLTQPVHAITVPRGGTRGYPQSRRIYATWDKPIVVLCNQNSFSNAEIFSHAIKTLNRGKLVGVQTSGSVISTGSRSIMDIGSLRLPFRGWYIHGSGEDMEHNGAVPDHVVWPQPGQLPAGTDLQLIKGLELLSLDVQASKLQQQPDLRKASER
jgi:tricorn protease